MTDEKTTPNYSVPALEKGLAVLEILAHASEPLSLSQISEITKKSTSKIFRTMNCLVERGYVTKDDVSGKYLLTLKLFELANSHSPLEHLLQMAKLPMQELAWSIRESCHISVMQHRQLLVMGEIESPEKVRISVSVGATLPLTTTVSGRLLLAAMDDHEINAILEESPDFTKMSAKEHDFFWEKISDIRQRGISTAIDESFIGLQDTAVLVGNPNVGVIAAVAVTQLTASAKEHDSQQIIEALHHCAKQINERAGLRYAEKQL